jgi:hypothetical protein
MKCYAYTVYGLLTQVLSRFNIVPQQTQESSSRKLLKFLGQNCVVLVLYVVKGYWIYSLQN